jgi:hypothetical protein
MTWSDKMKLSEVEYKKAMRFNFSYQYFQLVEFLLDSGLPIDRAMARVLIAISTHWNWLWSKSSINWLWFRANQFAAFILIRQPIDFVWEFSQWAPKGFFVEDGIDFSAIRDIEEKLLSDLDSLDVQFDLDILLDEENDF